MGKKLDALLGRNNFKNAKFKSYVTLATSRLSVFKNQRTVRCNQARSDVVQLLQQGYHERALLRVENVIKEQNMLDVYVMMEGYCNLLVERVHLIEQDRVCPNELKEAASSLLYASTRCGDFPELQEIRIVLASWYGKEFAARATELRNDCGVNHKMILKLSTRQPELEIRMKVLKEIAAENNIVLQLEEASPSSTKGKMDVKMQPEAEKSNDSGRSKVDNLRISPEHIEKDGFDDSVMANKKYKDVADAAQAAFESAAYAAAAARAAVELSRSEPHDPDNQNSPGNQGRKAPNKEDLVKLESTLRNQEVQIQNEKTGSEGYSAAEQKRPLSSATSDSDPVGDDSMRVNSMYLDAEYLAKKLEEDIVFYESDDENHSSDSKIRSGKIEGETQAAQKKIPPIIHAGLNKGKGPISVRTREVRGY